MNVKEILDTPVGANKRFTILFNENPYAGADTLEEAVKMVDMYRTVPKGRQSTTARSGRWAVKNEQGSVVKTWNN